MESSSLLVIGAGGLGCRWARGAHSRVASESDLMLVDADMESFKGASYAHCMHLDQPARRKDSCFAGSCCSQDHFCTR